jgi:phosphopantetheinyl transferase
VIPTVVSVDQVWEQRERFARSLTASEREVFDRLAVDKRRREWLAGRIAAKRAVQKELGLPFQRIEIRVEESGKPVVFIRGEASELFLSISHSEGVAAAIVSRAPIGFDLEKIETRDRSFEDLVLTDADRRRLDGLSGSSRDEWLTILWCEKEAYAKLAGEGLRIPFAELVVPADVKIERGRLDVAGVAFAFAISAR